MTTVYSCAKCDAGFAVASIDPNIGLLEAIGACPDSSCRGQLAVLAETNVEIGFKVQFMTAMELFRASQGFGTVEERMCSPAALSEVMIGAKVVSVEVAESSDPNRSLINSLTLDSGKVLYFASSTKGATIFKMTEAPDAR